MTGNHPQERLIGYARVSTYGQTLDSQLEQLRQAGCRNIYREKVTGARPDRRELNRMLGKLSSGDLVTVTRIDRLARSTFDLFGIVKRIVDAKAQFRSLAEPWADTGTSTGRLMLAVLGGLADVERDLIRTRTAEGRNRAKLKGKHMGRPPSLTPEQQEEAIRRRARGATLHELADSYDRSISTMRRAHRSKTSAVARLFDHLVGAVKSVGGTSRPSAFATIRLTTRPNLAGCSTGRSAGFAPSKILSIKSPGRR